MHFSAAAKSQIEFINEAQQIRKDINNLKTTLTSQINTIRKDTTADNIIQYFQENTDDTGIADEALKNLLYQCKDKATICRDLFETLEFDTTGVSKKLKPIATRHYQPLEKNPELLRNLF